MFINNWRFFCIKAFGNSNEEVLLIYNTTEPSSNLLEKNLPLSGQVTSYYNIYSLADDLYEELDFSDVSHIAMINYPVLLVLEKDKPYIRIYKKYNIIGDVSNEITRNYCDNNTKNHLFFELDLQYKNPFISYIIMVKLQINILLEDSLIRIGRPSRFITEKSILSDEKSKKTLSFNISDKNFLGPVENYRVNLINDTESKLSIKFQSYLDYNREFSDYEDDDSGYFIMNEERNGLLFLLTSKKIMIIDLSSLEKKSQYIISDYTICGEIRVITEEIMIFCQQSMEIMVFNFTNVDFSLNLVKIINFGEFFTNYLIVLESPPKYLIFLVEESHNKSKSQGKSLIFFTFPCSDNDFSFQYFDKISDDLPSSFFLSSIIDFQIIANREISETYSYVALILLSSLKSYYIKVLVYGSNEPFYTAILQYNEIDLLSQLNFTQYQYYKDFEFINFRILSSSIVVLDPINFFFIANITILVSSSLHTFLYKIQIPSEQQGQTQSFFLLKVFRKFYSCENIKKNRPKVFKDYLGMFCRRVSEGDEYLLKTYSYFLL